MRSGARPRDFLPVAAATVAGTVLLLALVAKLGVPGLAVPVAAVGVLFLLRRPGWCLGLYAALVILAEERPGSVLPGSWVYSHGRAGLSLPVLALGLFAAATLLDARGRRRGPSLHPGVAAATGLLVCGIAVGSVTGAFVGVGTTALYDNVISLLPLLVVPLAVHVTLHTARRVRVALAVVAGLVVFKATIGVVAVLGGLSTPDKGLGTSAGGTRLTYYEPTVNWLSLALLLVAFAAVLRRVALPRWVLLAMPVVAGSLLLSHRRSFWIATILGVFMVALFGASRLQRRLALPAAALVAVAIWVTFTLGGVTEQLSGSVVERATSLIPAKVVANREDRYRLDERANVVAAIRGNPVTGLGVGVPWVAVHPLPIDLGRQYVHFAVLWFWLKFGVLGALAYVCFVGSGVAAGLRASRRQVDPVLACVALGLVGAFFGLALAETTATFVGPDVRLSAVFAMALGLVSRLRVLDD